MRNLLSYQDSIPHGNKQEKNSWRISPSEKLQSRVILLECVSVFLNIAGLKACKYDMPTDVQRESIGLGLQGQDILGAAKTGSGKTLAFIVPVS